MNEKSELAAEADIRLMWKAPKDSNSMTAHNFWILLVILQ